MKVEVYGKVVERGEFTHNGVAHYVIVIEEQTKFPSQFRFVTRDVTLLGAPDGFAAVGRMVKASGFANGRRRTEYTDTATGEVKPFKVPRFEVKFTLSKLTVALVGNDGVSTASAASSDDDMPY